MAQLKSTVYVTDPDTHQTVRLDAGTRPQPRLAALVTNPAAWVDGKPPAAATEPAGGDGPGNAPDGASGDTSPGPSGAPEGDQEDTKPAAKKTAATRPARGRKAATEGDGGR